MNVFGVLSIRNGSGLGYPYPLVVKNLSALCDHVLIGIDPAFPEDASVVAGLQCANVDVIDASWDMGNRNAGSEIAIQMDSLVQESQRRGADWVVVLQADELFHERDFEMLRLFMERSDGVSGFRTNRLYFWRDLKTVRVDWGAEMVRIFRPGHYSFMAEGTDKAGMYSGKVREGNEVYLPYQIYHYSRVDRPEEISKRVRNLDSFFHEDGVLLPKSELPEYDFVPREYDNFLKVGSPRAVSGVFDTFTGGHPDGVGAWYGESDA